MPYIVHVNTPTDSPEFGDVIDGSILGVPFRATRTATWWTIDVADGMATLRLRAPDLPLPPPPVEPPPSPPGKPDPPPVPDPVKPDPVEPDPVPDPLPPPGKPDPKPDSPPPSDPRIALEAAADKETAEFIEHEAHGHPHGDSPAKQGEHKAALALVPVGQVTHRAIKGGWWSDPDIWAGRRIPGDGASVWIMPGRDVGLDTMTPRLRTVRIDGTLAFEVGGDTQLSVDTVVVAPQGSLDIGTKVFPVLPYATARILFIDTGLHDPIIDPFHLGRGLINHGKVTIHGAPVTPHVAMVGHPREGQDTIELAEAPQGWEAGRQVVISTLHHDEPPQVRVIKTIDGTTLYLDKPLTNAYELVPDDPDCVSCVGYLYRNVIFESENKDDIDERAHIMFMHNPEVTIDNAAFIELGRTDKSRDITDPVLDSDGRIVPGTDANPRGRYAVHFHRCGPDPSVPPVVLDGCLIIGSPGVGPVIHASHARVARNVIYRAGSSLVYCEVGNETGEIIENFLIGARMLGVDQPAPLNNWGRDGAAVFCNGAAVLIARNFINGCRFGIEGKFYDYVDGGVPVLFPVANLPDPSILPEMERLHGGQVKGQTEISPLYVPYTVVDNEIWGCGTPFYQASAAGGILNRYERNVAWNCGSGWGTGYSESTMVLDSTFRNYPDPSAQGTGFGISDDLGTDTHLDGADVCGWYVGVMAPRSGRMAIVRSVLENAVNVVIVRPQSGDADYRAPRRAIRIEATEFRRGAPFPGQDYPQADILWMADGQPDVPSVGLVPALSAYLAMVSDLNLPGLFDPDPVIYVADDGREWQVYSDDQRPGYVYRGLGIPELEGLTAQAAWDAYGLCFGDALAPETLADGAPPLRVAGGVLGPAPPLRATLLPMFWPRDERPVLTVLDLGVETSRAKPIEVFKGEVETRRGEWNVVTGITDVAGNKRSVLVKDTRETKGKPDGSAD